MNILTDKEIRAKLQSARYNRESGFGGYEPLTDLERYLFSKIEEIEKRLKQVETFSDPDDKTVAI